MLLLMLALGLALGLAVWLLKPSRKGLPPRAGPGMFTVVSKLTTISDLSSLKFLHDISLEVSKEGGVGATSRGAVFTLSMPQLSPYIVTTDYELARKVLEGSSRENIRAGEKTPTVRVFDYASTPSILTNRTDSAERHKHRKHLAVSFSVKNLEYTQKVMKECIQEFGKILQKHALDKTEIALDNVMIRLTLDIITESAFGENFNTLVPSDNNMGDFYMHENELFLKEAGRSGSSPIRKFMSWNKERQRAQAARTKMMELAQNLIEGYRKKVAGGEVKGEDNSIMGRLMSCDYDCDEKRAQDILIMLLGGHETSSHSVSYLILGLLRNPEAKKLLQAELDSCISAEALNDTTKLNCAEILALPYLSKCIKESMRLWSVIGGGLRRMLTEDVHYEGLVLPKGSYFHVATYSMARQPWINDPTRFIPERWSEDNPQHSQLKDMFIPFGAGQRQCIGQNLAKVEVALIAAYTLRFFDFDLLSGPHEQLFLTTKPVGMSVAVQMRK